MIFFQVQFQDTLANYMDSFKIKYIELLKYASVPGMTGI